MFAVRNSTQSVAHLLARLANECNYFLAHLVKLKHKVCIEQTFWLCADRVPRLSALQQSFFDFSEWRRIVKTYSEAGFIPPLSWVRSLHPLAVVFKQFHWVWILIAALGAIGFGCLDVGIAEDNAQCGLVIPRKAVQLVAEPLDVVLAVQDDDALRV